MASDDSTVSRRLAALAVEEPHRPGAGRVLGAAETPLDAILEEIDATILPAHLAFSAGTRKLEVMASKGCLRQILVAEPGVNTDRPGFAEAIGGDTGAKAEGASLILQSFAAGVAGDLMVRSTALDVSKDTGDGLSTGGIRVSLGLDTVTPGSRILRLAGSLEGAASAHLLIQNGKIEAEEGDETHASRLKSCFELQLADFAKAHANVAPDAAMPTLTCLNDTLDTDTGVAIAVANDEILMFSYPSRKLPAVHTLWRESA